MKKDEAEIVQSSFQWNHQLSTEFSRQILMKKTVNSISLTLILKKKNGVNTIFLHLFLMSSRGEETGKKNQSIDCQWLTLDEASKINFDEKTIC